jgi:fibronectin type 3 domain-containing protein
VRRNGFFIYRRVGDAVYSLPLVAEPLELRDAVDGDLPMGERACYVVRAIASTDPLIESAPSNEVCVERRDTTAPATPAGLALLPRSGGLEVLWSPSSEPDLAGYRVYRETSGQPRRRLAEAGTDKTSFVDETAAKGVTYRYTVTAFDQSGNESEPTDPVEGSLP